MTASVTFKYNGVVDLLCDAVFQYRYATTAADKFLENRFSRASILSSMLSLESAANSLLVSLDLPAKFMEDLDKLPVLAKFETYLRLFPDAKHLDRGRVEVQKFQDLIRARNDYVHPKVKTVPTEIQQPRDEGAMYALPIEFTGEMWVSLRLPKRPMFWFAGEALSVLLASVEFLKLVVHDCARLAPDAAQHALHSRLEIGNVHVIATFDEFYAELRNASKFGVNFEFLGVASTASSG